MDFSPGHGWTLPIIEGHGGFRWVFLAYPAEPLFSEWVLNNGLREALGDPWIPTPFGPQTPIESNIHASLFSAIKNYRKYSAGFSWFFILAASSLHAALAMKKGTVGLFSIRRGSFAGF